MPYFDHNATTPLSSLARETWLRASDEHWHNPSSPYRDAAKARIRLDGARERLAEFFHVKPEEIVFNSGATESAHAILGYLARRAADPASARVAVSRIEHPCMLAAAERHFPNRIRWLNTDRTGVVSLAEVDAALAEGPLAGVAVMAANNETGVLQPWEALAKRCRSAGVPYVCDAAQWLGKLTASGLGNADWVMGAAHKFGGPKGVGFMKLGPQAEGFRSQAGGEQEHGHRGGTENLPGIWGMVAAFAEAEQKKVFLETERLFWRQAFEREVLASLPGAEIVAGASERLWNTVSLILPFGENHRWVTKLDKRGFQVSTGSACATGKEGPSHVLAAMGYAPEQAKRVVRVSSGWETTREEWQALAAAIADVAKETQPPANVVTL